MLDSIGVVFLAGSNPDIPDDLTAEKYAAIKRKEAEKVSKMNFGAWGPRFKIVPMHRTETGLPIPVCG
jgi:hypothetical protein